MRRYYFILAASDRNSRGQMRQLYTYDANDVNESTQRLVEDGKSTGLNKHARGSWILCSGIKCSLENNTFSYLHYVIKVTLINYMLQSNLSNTDTEGTERSVRIREVSV